MNSCTYLIDEDRASRVAMSTLLRACGLQARPFISAADFFDEIALLRPCVILFRSLSVRKSSLRILSELRARLPAWPVILLADAIGVTEAVAAMKLGAFDVVEKPVEVDTLLQALEAGHQELAQRASSADGLDLVRARINSLRPRELEVLKAMLAGYRTREIAQLCNISARTVEAYRSRILKHLSATTTAGAMRYALEAGVQPLERDAPNSPAS